MDSIARSLGRLTDALESRIAPALERIAMALERSPGPGRGAEPSPHDRALGEIRAAVAEGRWSEAASGLDEYSSRFPGDPEVGRLGEAIATGRAESVSALRARLDASRSVNDPEAVLELHGQLSGLLTSFEERRGFDQEIVRWFLGLVQRRMRGGSVRADVVDLATRVVERFGETVEGASLRAALPTLRRCSGLCPRCGQPYDGLESACPRCLAEALRGAGPEVPAEEAGDDEAGPGPEPA